MASGARGAIWSTILRIALSVDLGDWDPNPDVRANTLRAAEALRAAGATVEEVDFRIDKVKLYEAAATHYASIFGPYVGGLIDEHRERTACAGRRG